MAKNLDAIAAVGAAALAWFGLREQAKEANTALQKSSPTPAARQVAPIQQRSRQTIATVKPTAFSLDSLYQKHGAQKGVDWRLLKAIARVESSENSQAKNPADPSYGLMQVLCRSACPTCKCTNVLNVLNWSEATPDKLFDPDFNLHIASQILKWNIGRYGLPKAIAVYNAWEARLDPDNGPFRNQAYVDKVTREWQALRAIPSAGLPL